MPLRRTATRRPLKRVRPRPAPLPVPPPEPAFDAAIVEQLTGDILQHLGAANSQSVEVRAEIGRLLQKVRTELPHGAFRPYLREHVPFDGSTAERAMNLHRFAEKQPTLFGKLKPLGVSKANALIKLPVDKLESLVSSAHDVPSTGAHKTLLAMTYGEMMEIVSDRASQDEHDKLVRDYRRAVRRLIRVLDQLQDEYQHIDPDDIADPYDELRFNLSQVGATFEL